MKCHAKYIAYILLVAFLVTVIAVWLLVRRNVQLPGGELCDLDLRVNCKGENDSGLVAIVFPSHTDAQSNTGMGDSDLLDGLRYVSSAEVVERDETGLSDLFSLTVRLDSQPTELGPQEFRICWEVYNWGPERLLHIWVSGCLDFNSSRIRTSDDCEVVVKESITHIIEDAHLAEMQFHDNSFFIHLP